MKPKGSKGWLVLAAAGLVLLPACASKKYVQDEVGGQATKIQSVENAVEENQRRIKDVDGRLGETDRRAKDAKMAGDKALTTGNQALSAAERAEKLARGTLILETTLTNDVTQFGLDTWELPEGAVPELDKLAAQILKMDRLVYLEVQGHTDSSGAESWNLDLGERRAHAVVRYLNQRGIPLFAMSAISHGSSQPTADNSTREGRAQNRRVVIRVLG